MKAESIPSMTIYLLTALSILPQSESFGLTSTKFVTRSSIILPMESTGVASKFMAKKKMNIGVDSTRLTSSTYAQARHVSKPFSWLLPSFIYKQAPLRWASKFLRRRGSVRIISATILAAIVIFAPAFSPARAATTVSAATATTTVARGISPVMSFSSKSRALGSFNFIPSKAELELCFRILYAACSGAFVGLERSSSDRPAGVRTMALVGLGASIYTICSTHGFLPHSALGCEAGSPLIANVKCDISRMAANIASGVGFIGAGAIHKSKLHGDGTEAQNVVAGLTTAAAIWVSAAVGIAAGVGLYFVGAVATFSTVAILKYARVPKDDVEPGVSWKPRPLEVVDDRPTRNSHLENSPTRQDDAISGLYGKRVVSDFDPQMNSFVDQDIIERYAKEPHRVIIKEVIDPRFEQFLQSQLSINKEYGGDMDQQELKRESKVLIEEEQEVIAYNATDGEHDRA